MSLIENHNSWLKLKPFKREVIKFTKSIIVPHAGIHESKLLATSIYKTIPEFYRHAILISTNHKTNDNHLLNSSLNDNKYNFKIDTLDLENYFNTDPNTFINEHSWKVQLPFLKNLNFETITVILIGNYDEELMNKVFDKININHFIIGDTDLLHCGIDNYNIKCPNNIEEYNIKTLDNIKNYYNGTNNNLDKKRDGYSTMCGYNTLKFFLNINKKLKLKLCTNVHLSHKFGELNDHSVGYPIFSFLNENYYSIMKIPRLISEYFLNNYKDLNSLSKKKILTIFYNLSNILYLEKLTQGSIFITIKDLNNKTIIYDGSIENKHNITHYVQELTLNIIKKAKLTLQDLPNIKFYIDFVDRSKTYLVFSSNSLLNMYNKIKIGLNYDCGLIFYTKTKKITILNHVIKNDYNIKNFTLNTFKKLINKLNLEPCDINKITIFRCKEYSEDVLSSLNDFRNSTSLSFYLLFLSWLSCQNI